MSTLLELKDLSIKYHASGQKAVKGFRLQVSKGETIGIVGESGSGKSSIALAIMGLLKTKATVCGTITYNGVTLNWDKEKDWDLLRWNKIAIVFQNALHVLNPQMKIGTQIAEPLIKHLGLSRRGAEEKIYKLLEEVGLEVKWAEAYPHQLSGGMRQKVLIAMALACDPELLIVDEPTMSLDPDAKMHMVHLLKRVQAKHQCGMVVISHEMNIIKALCSTIHVLYDGNHLEYGETNAVISQPKHPYTKGLTGASWELDPYKEIWGIPHKIREGEVEGCPFYSRCFQARDVCKMYSPKSLNIEQEHDVACARGGIATLLKANHISKTFKVGKHDVLALKDVKIEVKEGEIVVVMGHSGSGKSTLAAILSGLEKMNKLKGSIEFDGTKFPTESFMGMEGGIQLIAQDPSTTMNPEWSVQKVLEEPLRLVMNMEKKEAEKRICSLLEKMNLASLSKLLDKKTGSLSGGQKQRVAIARALLLSPKVIIADEISAMLDPSSAANLIRTLKGLQNKNGFSMIYITHDRFLARKIADRVIFMKQGEVIQTGTAGIITVDENPYREWDFRYADGDN